MWRFLRSIGGYSTEYEMQDWTGHAEKSDPSQVPLDPIQVAGQADMANLAKAATEMNLSFAQEALRICMDPAAFLSLLREQEPRWDTPVTSEKWSSHVESLVEYKVIRPIPSQALVNSAKYFGVFKSPEIARSIWNGRSTSRLLCTPKNVNLPYLPRVLKMIDDLTRKHGSVAFIEGDIRHFFHQLSVHSTIGRYLGLRLRSKKGTIQDYAWNCVPMGLSWSPYIAQSIAWLSILYRRSNQKSFFQIEASQLKELPEFWRKVVS